MLNVPMPMDHYDLKARLYPGLLVTLPVFAAVVTIFPRLQHPKALGVGLFLECALLFWLMRIARDQGKRVEPKLFREWGGRPTTILLRWSDAEIDPITKARYHNALSSLIKAEFPSAMSEEQNRSAADLIYDSAVRALIEKRRGKAYPLVFAENCNYGFARNLYSLRCAGVLSNVGTAVLLCVAVWFRSWHVSQPMIGIAALDIFCSCLLVGFASKAFVRRSGFAYASALLRTCEALAPARKRNSLAKSTGTTISTNKRAKHLKKVDETSPKRGSG